jgi:UDP-N-acetylglucosamine diphosphorylase / glucose-1-phosphate thymidylyltransferase / UDP-N-acetylgalactosamine diphosphorylase / glucosamine-1-phosphate N-acetyltransferase / galactosamine-1-phosphate N-acetyltransferase
MTFESLCSDLVGMFPRLTYCQYPWQASEYIEDIIRDVLPNLGDEYLLTQDVAIHKSAKVDATATLHGPAIIGRDCFVGPHVLLRGGVYVGEGSSIGPGCDIKHSLIGEHTALAHFNFVGDSIIGSRVNFEAGAITANHYNERENKMIFALWDGKMVETGSIKFGTCVGDDTKIGANAVTSPGTILKPKSVVRRLELIEQDRSSYIRASV